MSDNNGSINLIQHIKGIRGSERTYACFHVYVYQIMFPVHDSRLGSETCFDISKGSLFSLTLFQVKKMKSM